MARGHRWWLVVAACLAVALPGCGGSGADAAPGQCLPNGIVDAQYIFTPPTTVPCAEAHLGEIFAVIDYPAEAQDFPGQDVVTAVADHLCWLEMEGYLGGPVALTTAKFTELTPTGETWELGDRAIVCIFVTDEPRTGSWRGAVAGSGVVSTFFIPIGTCFDTDDIFVEEVATPLDSCDSPHTLEVYAQYEFPDVFYPGESAVISAGDERCAALLAALTSEDVTWSYLYPTQGTWDTGDRVVTCIAEFEPGTTGSIVEG